MAFKCFLVTDVMKNSRSKRMEEKINMKKNVIVLYIFSQTLKSFFFIFDHFVHE